MDIESLTQTERKIAQMAVNGLTNEEIAIVANITVATVKVHVRSLFKKLNIRRRHELLWAFHAQRVYRGKDPTVSEDRTILDLMVDGLTNEEIAKKLDMSTSALHMRILHLRSEIGFSTRNELAMWWLTKTQGMSQSETNISAEEKRALEGREFDPPLTLDERKLWVREGNLISA